VELPSALDLRALRRFASGHVPVTLPREAWARIEASARVVREVAAGEQAVYGVNTGFGRLAQVRIAPGQVVELQRNLILSHCCGVGPPLPEPVVRLMMVLKILSLAHGYSGVGRGAVEALIALLNHEVYPRIPGKGSVGASGDLAPLAHMSAVLLGTGEAVHKGRVLPAREALALCGLQPLALGAKEGLALINGTQTSTALGLYHLFRIEDVFAAAVCAGALSVDAMMGSDVPFDPRIHELRNQPGQKDVAACYRRLLEGSEIRASHLVDCEKVQDQYSLRCQPQVMGAVLDSLRHAAAVLEREANGVTDNPLVFADTGEVLSGGNFHGEPVAIAADLLALAVAEIGSLSERRIALLLDPVLSGLPAFLVPNPGLHSGFMIAQVTAAALASENKSLAHPASVDSLPTSANQEDHVSMSTFAARRLGDMVQNAAAIVAIELLAAAQAVEFRAPKRTSPLLSRVVEAVRERVPRYEHDRYFAPDIEAAQSLIGAPVFTEAAGHLLPGCR